ncbi:MAG: DUF4199 domain-containing protein [Nitritalea sp.]
MSYLKQSLVFGIMGGIFSSIAFYVFYWMDFEPTKMSQLFGFVTLPFFILIALIYTKRYLNGGYLSFAQGMSMGFLVYMLVAMLSAYSIFLAMSFDPDLFQEVREAKIAALITTEEQIVNQLGQESYDVTLESVRNLTRADLALNEFIWKVLPGLFYTIVIAVILRKNKPL